MREIEFRRKAASFLDVVPKKHARQISKKLEQLKEIPRPQQSKQLKGSKGFYAVSAGEYRIVYTFDEERLHIWTIGKRNDAEVYKQIQRRTVVIRSQE